MKFKFLILLLCILPTTVLSQETINSVTSSVWIGKIKMGDANPELVFYIFKDSSGQLAGTLGVPSKGVQGIVLSTVQILQDSIFLEIAAAQASYKGELDKDKQIIKGVWKEGPSSYPLILEPLTKEIDYADFKHENTSDLSLHFSSENFNFYSKKEDTKVLENLSKTLESNYSRLTSAMQTSFDSKIDVFIYPELQSFHSAINYPDAPDWVVGAASKNELKMVSPLNPGSEHSYESLMKAIVHELTHTVVLNIRKQGLLGLSNWLNEGYAYYEAQQLTQADRDIIHSDSLMNKLPTWNEIEIANTSEFGDMRGYPISAAIVEFLIETYGFDDLQQLIIAPERLEEIYGLPKEELEVLWLENEQAMYRQPQTHN